MVWLEKRWRVIVFKKLKYVTGTNALKVSIPYTAIHLRGKLVPLEKNDYLWEAEHACIRILPINTAINSQENIHGRANNRDNSFPHRKFSRIRCILIKIIYKSGYGSVGRYVRSNNCIVTILYCSIECV